MFCPGKNCRSGSLLWVLFVVLMVICGRNNLSWGNFWTKPGQHLGDFLGDILGISWRYLGDIWGISGGYLGDILGISWGYRYFYFQVYSVSGRTLPWAQRQRCGPVSWLEACTASHKSTCWCWWIWWSWSWWWIWWSRGWLWCGWWIWWSWSCVVFNVFFLSKSVFLFF